MANSQPPELRVSGPEAVVTLRRPEQANRLELVDIETLEAYADSLRQRSDIRTVVLRSEGRHFCSGFQIDSVPDIDAPALFDRLCGAWEALPQITIAALQGGVWGGGADLALSCDFRLGTRRCTMAIPAARLGLHYHVGGMRRVISRLGLSAGKRLLLGAQTWDAATMVQQQFLDEIYADEAELEGALENWITEILELAPLALQGMKRTLNNLATGQLDQSLALRNQLICLSSDDLREGVVAWREGRRPLFQGT